MSATITQPTNAVTVPIRVNGRFLDDGTAFIIAAYVDRFPGRVWLIGPRTGGSQRVYGAREHEGTVQVRVWRWDRRVRRPLLDELPDEDDLKWHTYEPEGGELVYAQ